MVFVKLIRFLSWQTLVLLVAFMVTVQHGMLYSYLTIA